MAEHPETEEEWGIAVLSWWLRLSPEARERYERMRRAEPLPADEGTTDA